MINNLKQWLQTIRGRLTLWYVGTFTLLFGVFLITASFIFWNILNQQVEHHLSTVLEQVETVWEQSGQEGEEIIQSLVASQGMVVMVMAPDGEVLLQSTSEDITLPTQHQLQQHLVMLQDDSVSVPHYFSIDDLRFALTPASISPTVGVIGVGYQTAVLQNTFRQSLLSLGGLFLISVMLLSWVGYILAKRALQPVQTITKTAKAITSSSDLSARIPSEETQGELGELVQVLNSMLVRLEDSFKNQKQFLSDAAHTLKTPLTVLRTHIEALDAQHDEKQKTYDTLDQLNETVQDLLYISKLHGEVVIKKEPIDVSQVVQDVIEITQTLADEKGITVNTQVEEGITLEGDRSLLTRALLNVAENAITYTPAGGTVEISLTVNDSQTMITFQDTGIGIPAKELDKITSRFYRASNSVEHGTGLGLAISKAVAESFGGGLEIESVEGEGTTVRFVLKT